MIGSLASRKDSYQLSRAVTAHLFVAARSLHAWICAPQLVESAGCGPRPQHRQQTSMPPLHGHCAHSTSSCAVQQRCTRISCESGYADLQTGSLANRRAYSAAALCMLHVIVLRSVVHRHIENVCGRTGRTGKTCTCHLLSRENSTTVALSRVPSCNMLPLALCNVEHDCQIGSDDCSTMTARSVSSADT